MAANRARLSSLPFPTISVFAIYSADDLPDSSPTAEDDEASADDGARADKDEQAQELAKVVFWHSQVEDISNDRKARLMGTIRGMADFARMLSAGGGSVRSVHSSRQRMLWFEPEDGYSIHATIELPRASKHTRGTSTASDTTAPPSTLPLDDGALIAAIAHAYGQYRLRHGSFAGAVEQGGRQELVKRLEGWWNEFVKKWRLESAEAGAFERTVGGLPQSPLTHPTSAQLDPLLAQFAASNSSATAVVLHNKSILALPTLAASKPSNTNVDSPASSSSPTSPAVPSPPSSARPPRARPPPLSESDLLALVAHIADRVIIAQPPPAPTVRPSTPVQANTTNGAPASLNATGSTTPKWYQLGLFADAGSGLPSVAMPAMPSMSMPALSMPAMPTMNMTMPSMPNMPIIPGLSGLSGSPATSSPLAQAAAADAKASPGASGSPGKAAGWGGRTVSWGAGVMGLGGKHKKSGSTLSTVTTTPAVDAEPAADEQPAEGAAAAESLEQPTSEPPAAEEDAPEEPESNGPPEGGAVTPPAQVPNSVTPGSVAAASPAVDLHREVDPVALAEAMASMEALAELEAEEEQTKIGGDNLELTQVVEETVPDEPVVVPSIRQVIEVFVGDGAERDTHAEVWSFQRGPVTLALATVPVADTDAASWLESRAMRLLEAIETVLDTPPSSSKPYLHSHLVKTGSLTSSSGFASADSHWSGKASADEQDATAALFDSVRQAGAQPPIVESFVRLASSQWIIRQKAVDPFEQTETDIYLNLPAKVGKEGSLVDAAEELRRLKRTTGVIGA